MLKSFFLKYKKEHRWQPSWIIIGIHNTVGLSLSMKCNGSNKNCKYWREINDDY